MKYILSLLFAVMSLTAAAQSSFTTATDDKTGSLIFKGAITFSDLHTEPSFKWMQSGYKPDSAAIQALKDRLPAYRILVIMGTWCDDSQNLVPKLEKVLNEVGYPIDQLGMWGVDRDKQTGGPEKDLYKIERVPTIILMKGDQEIGRIVESVQKSVEADLVTMISK